MLKIGQYNTLTITRFTDHGAYLDAGKELGDILLPKQYVKPEMRPGTEVEVIVYLDLVKSAFKPCHRRRIADMAVVLYRLGKRPVFCHTFFELVDDWCIFVFELDIQLSELRKCPVSDIAGAKHHAVFAEYQFCMDHFRRQTNLNFVAAIFHKKIYCSSVRVVLIIGIARY